MTMLEQRPKTQESVVASGLKNLRIDLDRKILDVIIDIGLALSELGKKDQTTATVSYAEDTYEMELVKSERTINDEVVITYEVIEFSQQDPDYYKGLFHAIISSTGITMQTFVKGEWEINLRHLAETIRLARGINAKDNKEKEGEEGSTQG